jgi:hypothetical protein
MLISIIATASKYAPAGAISLNDSLGNQAISRLEKLTPL